MTKRLVNEFEFSIFHISTSGKESRMFRRHDTDDKKYFISFSLGCQSFRTDNIQMRSGPCHMAQKLTVYGMRTPLRVWLHDCSTERIIGRLQVPIESIALSGSQSQCRTVPFVTADPQAEVHCQLIFLTYECVATNLRDAGNWEWLRGGRDHLLHAVDVCVNGDWSVPRPKALLKRMACCGQDCSRLRHSPEQREFASIECDQSIWDEMTPSSEALAETKKVSDATERSESAYSYLPELPNLPVFRPRLESGGQSLGRGKTLTARRDTNKKLRRNSTQPEVERFSLHTDGAARRQTLRQKRRNSRDSGTRHPIIESIDPPFGSVLGRTRLTITGRFLGEDAQDVDGLYICGSNCLASLEYESSAVIYCTTKSWRACTGEVTVITATGGRSTGAAAFTFQKERSFEAEDGADTDEDAFSSPRTVNVRARGSLPAAMAHRSSAPVWLRKPTDAIAPTRRSMMKTVDDGTQTTAPYKAKDCCDSTHDVSDLHDQIIELRLKTVSQQEYIDELVAKVIEFAPDILSHLQPRIR